MKPTLTTEQALKALADGKLCQVCLVCPQNWAVMVTFDAKTQEFVVADPWCLRKPPEGSVAQRISVAEILFHTVPIFTKLATVA